MDAFLCFEPQTKSVKFMYPSSLAQRKQFRKASPKFNMCRRARIRALQFAVPRSHRVDILLIEWLRVFRSYVFSSSLADLSLDLSLARFVFSHHTDLSLARFVFSRK